MLNLNFLVNLVFHPLLYLIFFLTTKNIYFQQLTFSKKMCNYYYFLKDIHKPASERRLNVLNVYISRVNDVNNGFLWRF